mgnify:CR=1 FL=1
MDKKPDADLLKSKQEKIEQLEKERKMLMKILYKTKQENKELREELKATRRANQTHD